MLRHKPFILRRSARIKSRSTSGESPSVSPTICRKRKEMEDDDDVGIGVAAKRKPQNVEMQERWPQVCDEERRRKQVFPSRSYFRFQNLTTSAVPQTSPLPPLSWADSAEVWRLMQKKEQMYVRDPRMFDNHPHLRPYMREILLDWLIDVCEVYKLHREAFHLAIDFIDRYLSKQSMIPKGHLQLIGITALFIAAKIEEIYPPRLQEFAFVTDGHCTEDEILKQELIMLMNLNWDLAPMTVNAWISLFLQVADRKHKTEVERKTEFESGFEFPRFSAHSFIQITRLIDLCMYDLGSVKFNYSVIAASALYHMTSQDLALSVSGFQSQDLLLCVQWMTPFADTVQESGPVEVKFFESVPTDDCYNIQSRSIDLKMLYKAQHRHETDDDIVDESQRSPDVAAQVITLLTPPCSDEKPSQAQHFHPGQQTA